MFNTCAVYWVIDYTKKYNGFDIPAKKYNLYQIPFDIVTVITNGGGPKDNKIHPGGLM